jgi:hypothetical protein
MGDPTVVAATVIDLVTVNAVTPTIPGPSIIAMQWRLTMLTSTRGLFISVAALLAAVSAAPAAQAGCGGGAAVKQPSVWQAAPTNDANALLNRVDFGRPDFVRAPIVGLWSFSFVAGGAQVDWGYTEWHSDGTEITNSGGHSPASGNFCLGVWRQTGPSTFHLKHFPLGYDPSTGLLAVKVILTEDVTVDRTGANFSGPFTEDIYDPTGVTLLQHVAGTVTGHRVEPN